MNIYKTISFININRFTFNLQAELNEINPYNQYTELYDNLASDPQYLNIDINSNYTPGAQWLLKNGGYLLLIKTNANLYLNNIVSTDETAPIALAPSDANGLSFGVITFIKKVGSNLYFDVSSNFTNA